jgi:archaellum component FlaF (FlaF/FlaG flagellin family)
MDENASRIKSVSINLYNLGKTILAFESSSNDLEIISGFLIYEDKGMISSLLSGAYYYRTKDESANFTQAKQQETDHLIQKYKIDAKHANYLSNPTGKKHYTIFTPNEAVPVKSLFNAFLEGSMNKDDFSYEIID